MNFRKSILLSLKPYYYYLISEGIKTVEIRKNKPTSYYWNKDIFVYMTKDSASFNKIPEAFQSKYKKHIGKVGLSFHCNNILKYDCEYYSDDNDVYKAIHKIDYPYADENDFDWEDRYEIASNENETGIVECELLTNACLSFDELGKYLTDGLNDFYSWYIENPIVYNKPKDLSIFYRKKKCTRCLDTEYEVAACCYDEDCRPPVQVERPPQSWCYIEEIKR